MNSFVLDCSVAMGWCFEDQADAYTEQVLHSFPENSAVVPELWSYEVANVLLTAERRKKITAADSAEFLNLLGGLPILTVEERGEGWSERIVSLGRSYLLSAYDAVYLYLDSTAPSPGHARYPPTARLQKSGSEALSFLKRPLLAPANTRVCDG